MNNRITKTLRAKAGFTLVELIVVIAILGILAGVGTVGYSGYIKKANEAADQQLLGFVNQAFAAACVENGEDMSTLGDGSATMPLTSEKKINVAGVTPAAYQSAFAKYFAGNESAMFKVYNALQFKGGVFVGTDAKAYKYGDSTVYLTDADIKALQESAYITADGLGIENLLTKVDSVVNFGTGMILNEEGTGLSAFGQLLNTDEYRTFLANSLGFESTNSAFDDKMAELSGGDPTVAQKILVNNAVLYAAKNSTTSKDDLFTILTSTNPKKAITDGMDGDTGKGLAQASAAYGLYTAYVYALPDDYTEEDSDGNTVTKQQLIANTSNPVDILNGLDNENFQKYLKNADGSWTEQAQRDFDGYMAAMNMINSSSANNTAAVEKLLTNGFTDPDLVELLQSTSSN